MTNGRKLNLVGGGTCIVVTALVGAWIWRIADPLPSQPSQKLSHHTDSVYAVAFSPTGKLLVSGSADKTAIVWDTAGSQPLFVLRGHAESVTSVAFTKDGELIATGSADASIKLWNAADGAEVASLPTGNLNGNPYAVHAIALSSDGKTLAAVLSDHVAIWNLATRKPKKIIYGVDTLHGYSEFYGLAFSQDGKMATSEESFAGWGGEYWLRTYDSEGRDTLQIATAAVVKCIAWSPDGKAIAGAISGEGGGIKIFDAVTGKVIEQYGKDQSVNSVAFSPDGSTLAAGTADGSLFVWNIVGGTQSFFEAHTGPVHSVGFNHDGTIVASGGADGRLKLWAVARK